MFDPGRPGATPVPASSVPASPWPASPASPSPGTPTSVAAAVAMAKSALAYLAGAGAALAPVAAQAECLRGLGQIESLHLVARSAAITAFGHSRGYEADGQYSARAWLRWQTRSSGGAAGAAVHWARRLEAHPALAEALATQQISVSYAKAISDWTGKLPEEHRAGADRILLDAAARGVDLADLARLAEQIAERTAQPDTDDGDGGFRDRSVRLVGLFGGRGSLDGDLTPECHATVEAALGALSKRAGPEDLRTLDQRQHDALEEICRRSIASGTLPDRAGQPTQVQLHMTLDQLMGRTGAPETASARSAGGAAPDGQPGWILDPIAAQAYACDANLTPIVTGHVDRVQLALAVRTFMAAAQRPPRTECAMPGCDPGGCPANDYGPVPMSLGELMDLFLRQAIEVLSGPTGLAAHLRATSGEPACTGISLPLDVGAVTPTIPPHLRRAVINRDRHCAFPGCHQAPAACQVHHVIPRSQGGTTSLTNLVLLCSFHHLIAIHRWGWALLLNADGTTAVTSPDGQQTFHSHAPPHGQGPPDRRSAPLAAG